MSCRLAPLVLAAALLMGGAGARGEEARVDPRLAEALSGLWAKPDPVTGERFGVERMSKRGTVERRARLSQMVRQRLYARRNIPEPRPGELYAPSRDHAFGMRITPLGGSGPALGAEITHADAAPDPNLRLNWRWGHARTQPDRLLDWSAVATGGWSYLSGNYVQTFSGHLGLVHRQGPPGAFSLAPQIAPQLAYDAAARESWALRVEPRLAASARLPRPNRFVPQAAMSASVGYGMGVAGREAPPSLGATLRLRLGGQP